MTKAETTTESYPKFMFRAIAVCFPASATKNSQKSDKIDFWEFIFV